jgi:hypothetical protein
MSFDVFCVFRYQGTLSPIFSPFFIQSFCFFSCLYWQLFKHHRLIRFFLIRCIRKNIGYYDS